MVKEDKFQKFIRKNKKHIKFVTIMLLVVIMFCVGFWYGFVYMTKNVMGNEFYCDSENNTWINDSCYYDYEEEGECVRIHNRVVLCGFSYDKIPWGEKIVTLVLFASNAKIEDKPLVIGE